MTQGYTILPTDRYIAVAMGEDWDAATLHTVINGWADQGYDFIAHVGMTLVFKRRD